jgi:hypothetical protein
LSSPGFEENAEWRIQNEEGEGGTTDGRGWTRMMQNEK